MKIKLIAPHERSENSISSAETFKIRRLNLPLLAALTPAEHEVTIVDEAFAPDDIREDVDLVGITVMTDLVPRAYSIADSYRRRGVNVVMGGIHPTVLCREALMHADAVVVGEAETMWPKLVSDFASGRLERVYCATRPSDLRNLPKPRWDLYPTAVFKGRTPISSAVMTSRGCPYDCEFCSIHQVFGHRYRTRPISEVLAEVESIDSSFLFFVDDSLGMNRPAAKRLFDEMIPLRKVWAGQGTVSLAEDPELLRAMRRSGCLGLLIGFESVQQEAREGMRKTKNLRFDFLEAMRRFHGEGLMILGAFIFGFDHESRDVFDETLEFIMRCRMDCVSLRILTPFPGTRLYARLLNEGRLFSPDWWLHGYPPDTLLYQPRGMTPEELLDGFARLNKQTYSFRAIGKRFFGMRPWKRTAMDCQVYAAFNLATRRRYLTGLRIPQPFVEASGRQGFAVDESPRESAAPEARPELLYI